MSIRCTVLLATLLLIGVLYVFTTYAVDVAFGPKGFAAFASQTGNASWEGLERWLYGLFWFFVFLARERTIVSGRSKGRPPGRYDIRQRAAIWPPPSSFSWPSSVGTERPDLDDHVS
jgi:hypothetical protein